MTRMRGGWLVALTVAGLCLSASAYELYPASVVTTTDEGTNELSAATVEVTAAKGDTWVWTGAQDA